MTRGRPPVKAVKEAIEMAKSRGGVWEVPENAGLPFDIVIFSGFCTWFVKVRRTRSNVTEPPEIRQLCSATIRELRTLPESAASARELWTLSPHGTWQFFRITAEAVAEVRRDGSLLPGTVTDSPDPHIPHPAGPGIPGPWRGVLPSVPGGIICPYLSSHQGRT
ncbi:MAG: hypothetical protein WC593_14370 [Methanoregula sp.]